MGRRSTTRIAAKVHPSSFSPWLAAERGRTGRQMLFLGQRGFHVIVHDRCEQLPHHCQYWKVRKALVAYSPIFNEPLRQKIRLDD